MDQVIFVLNIVLVALGFGFVIFWHELGHFLAAKWAGVRVEQFAIGFGNAIVSYRKGLGFRRGTSYPEYERVLQQEREGIERANARAISATEYRLNWIPLGGYVKMYGQEDMVASTSSTEADHYMNKSVGKRMIIISAGVVMNVILAAFLFTVLFFWGYHPPAPVIGTVLPGDPGDRAGLQVGDKIVAINGNEQYAWTNISLTTALLKPDVPATFTIQPAGTGDDPAARKDVPVTPSRTSASAGMVSVGILPTPSLKGVDPRFVREDDQETLRRLLSPDQLAVGPGEVILEIQGTPVGEGDYYVLHRALAASEGEPVDIVVRSHAGTLERRQVLPRLPVIDGTGLAGLLPLVEVLSVSASSPNVGKLLPGDVIVRLTVSGTADTVRHPSFTQLRDLLKAAGGRGQKVDVLVQRDGSEITLEALELTIVNPKEGQYGLGFAPVASSGPPVIGGVEPDSPAARSGVPSQGRVAAVNGQAVENWHDVYAHLRRVAEAEESAVVIAVSPDGETDRESTREFALTLDEPARLAIIGHAPVAQLYFVFNPELADVMTYKTELKTRNPLQAMWWGVRETRDQIVKLYLTLKRVAYDRTVPASNLTGPVGIFHFGTILAQKGPDWIIWFLAMISANLAVVNFLPIPILDGGHMVFLASEKITGKPPSPKVQTAALYAGLLLIVGLVLFVTYNDLQRLLFA